MTRINDRPARRPLVAVARWLALPLALSMIGSIGSEVEAATLEVRGVDGAEVLILGEVLAVLPMAAPIEVDVGTVVLEVRAPGYVVHFEGVDIPSSDTAMIVDLELDQLSRWRAVTSSVALAGLGQLYQRRGGRGWTMIALQGAAWVGVALAETQFQSDRDDFELLERQYQTAVGSADIVRLRGEVEAAFDDVQSSEDIRNYAVAAVIAIGAWSVFDVWRAHDGYFFAGEVPAIGAGSPAGSGAMTSNLQVGWQWRF